MKKERFTKITVIFLLTFMFMTVSLAGAQENLALNKPVEVSGNSSYASDPESAVDGDTSTRWASAWEDPSWIYVDLGSACDITRVVFNWHSNFGVAYQVQVSNDVSNWTDIYSTTSGNGGIDDLSVSGNGRFVRMYGTERANQWAYSLYEFEVYSGGSEPTPDITPAPTPTPVQGNPVIVNNDETGIIYYSGDWSHSTQNGAGQNNTISVTNDTSAIASLTFYGTSIKYYAKKGSRTSITEIWLDGNYEASVDFYEPNQVFQVLAYENNNLEPGTHTIEIRNTNTHKSFQ